MKRRAFLAANAAAVGMSFAGCVTYGGEPHERLKWTTDLGASPDSLDSLGLTYSSGTIAARSSNRLFGIDRSGELLWEALEHSSGAFGIKDGFLGIDWPGYHPQNDKNEAVLKRLSPGGDTLWTAGRYVLQDLVVGSDRLFVLRELDSELLITACSLDDGAELWTIPVDSSTRFTRLSRNHVVAAGDDIVAYNRASGEKVWSAEPFDRYFPPAIDGTRIYLTSEEAPYRVLVVDETTGQTVNRYEVGSEMRPTGPLMVHDKVGIGTAYDGDKNPFFAVEPATGDVRWWTTPEDEMEIADSPRVAGARLGETIFLFDFKSILHAIDTADGSEQWSFDVEKNYPVVGAGRDTVYVLADATMYALDAS